MSRFSPTVAPNSGEAFGRALQQSVGAYLQARQQKQQDEAEMLGRGYIPAGSPAAPQPTQQGSPTPTLPAAPQAPPVDQGAIARMGGAGAMQPQSPIPQAQPFNRGAVTPADQLGAGQGFSAMLGAQATPLQVAPPAQPQGATSQSLAKAAGLNTYNSPSGGAIQPAPVHLFGRDWQMTPTALAQMEMTQATARANLGKTASETAKNYREMAKPQIGDADYNALTAGEAGAKAAATLPYDISKAVGTAKATLSLERTPEKFLLNGQPVQGFAGKFGDYYDASGKPVTGQIAPYVDPESKGLRELTISDRENALLSRTEARLVGQYHDATKKYSQTADALQAINENRAAALKGNPIAQQTLLQDFVKLNLPGQQVTEGELHNYAGLMGLGEKGGQLIQKLQEGSPFSTKMIERILALGDSLAAQRRMAAKYMRDKYVARAARWNVPEDAFEDWFGFLPPLEGGAAGSGSTPPPLGGDTAGTTAPNPFASLIPGKKP